MKKLLNRILIRLGLKKNNPTHILIKRDISDQIRLLNPGGAMIMSLLNDSFDEIKKSPSVINLRTNEVVGRDQFGSFEVEGF